MKLLLSILFVIPATLCCQAQLTEIPKQIIPEEYGFVVKIGQEMPDIQFKLPDGTRIKTSDLKGKVVMLQFTASWCGVCRKEMPHIEKDIWQKHKNNK